LTGLFAKRFDLDQYLIMRQKARLFWYIEMNMPKGRTSAPALRPIARPILNNKIFQGRAIMKIKS
jgi:hypothetical protein